jgi:hypothetical protein
MPLQKPENLFIVNAMKTSNPANKAGIVLFTGLKHHFQDILITDRQKQSTIQ